MIGELGCGRSNYSQHLRDMTHTKLEYGYSLRDTLRKT